MVKGHRDHEPRVIDLIQRQLDGAGAVEIRLLAGEKPDQQGEMKGVLRDRFAVGDAAQEVTAARHAVERLELQQEIEQADVGVAQAGWRQEGGLQGRPAPSQPRDM